MSVFYGCRHWIAVFGIVLGRPTKTSVETLLHAVTSIGMYQYPTRVSDALVSAVAVVRALDQAKRRYHRIPIRSICVVDLISW